MGSSEQPPVDTSAIVITCQIKNGATMQEPFGLAKNKQANWKHGVINGSSH